MVLTCSRLEPGVEVITAEEYSQSLQLSAAKPDQSASSQKQPLKQLRRRKKATVEESKVTTEEKKVASNPERSTPVVGLQ